MKKLATAIAAIALIGTPAFAADMAGTPQRKNKSTQRLRQLRNIRRDPPRLVLGEQLSWIGETQRNKTLAEKNYTQRENYSFFGRYGLL